MVIKGRIKNVRKPQQASAGKGIGAAVGGVTYSTAAKIAAEGIYELGEFYLRDRSRVS
ncbi:hypothetical protein V12B01_09371 [Vibrio splendidus 12B01]|jgi:hypothetical protein|nr:hypothetical protein V12B01_09371 [Vibrio splendidus 12B01]